MLTQEQVKAYHRDGYVIAKALFEAEEIDLLRRTAVEDRQMDQRSFGGPMAKAARSVLRCGTILAMAIYGMVARCHRVVNAMEQLLAGEVYHYHSQDDLEGRQGRWRLGPWHQDYGYWYENYVLYPLMSSVSIAVDPATP